MERTLVLIKPDAVAKRIAGHVISDLYSTNLKMIGLKIVNVKKELAEKHYYDIPQKHGQEVFEKLIKHLIGDLHNHANVIAIVYEGENAIKKIRELAGSTHPEKADFCTLRGKYGRVNSETDCFENVIHTSDSPESAEKEISLWFDEKELIN
ncbi:nucleoside-diphosphate kinase [Candidatus Pacearchaeota archaeon CG_4_9_14_0_2_um_filter_30_8]|nr:MAG: nucleoside-diphosphate kinase [Candidatus Pacearchaeota archaeon CG_4_9_14_0_2_um_filter_30_8]